MKDTSDNVVNKRCFMMEMMFYHGNDVLSWKWRFMMEMMLMMEMMFLKEMMLYRGNNVYHGNDVYHGDDVL